MTSLIARSLLRRAVSIPVGRSVWMCSQRQLASPVIPRMVSPVCRYSSTLSELLAREYSEEEENGNLNMPDDLVDLQTLVSKDWTIVDDKDSGTVKMFKKVGVSKVSVVFHCQDTVDNDSYMDEEYDDEAETPVEEEISGEMRFLVTVTKAGKTLVLSCVAVDTNVSIETVATTTEEVEEIQANGKVSGKLYQGPQFDELAEDVQDAFHSFVTSECGINADVAAFISMFADFKEQEEYARWIKQVRTIID